MRIKLFVLVAALALSTALAWADDAPEAWEFAGVMQASATASVKPELTGHLTRVAVKEGTVVAKGELLVEIDPRPYQLALDAALAQVLVAEARLQGAKLDRANAEALFEKAICSKIEVQIKMALEDEAQAALSLAKVEVERAKLTLSWTHIAAPFDGTVSRLQVTEGSIVAADQTEILRVVSTNPLHISFNVPESILLQLRRAGLAVPGKLHVAVGYADEPEHPHMATLDLIDPEINSTTAAVRFRATLPNPDGILSPGMTVRVRLTADSQ